MKMNFNGKPLLVCVVGATGIGKTNLAIAIAKAFSTEVISADARQFYKEMNIGTAVPNEKELSTVPHHFIQSMSIFNPYSVGDFEQEALAKLELLFKRKSIVVLVGGSGLYIDALVNGLNEFPKIPSDITRQLKSDLNTKGIEALQQELAEKDPTYFQKVDPHNPHRIIRALSIIRHTGDTFSSFHKKQPSLRNFIPVYVGLTADRNLIYERINDRVDLMMKQGLLDEARALWPNKELNALQTVGYRELFSHFEGEITLDQAVEEIKKNTRRYAKRQTTWFGKNNAIKWFDTSVSTHEIIAYIATKKAL